MSASCGGCCTWLALGVALLTCGGAVVARAQVSFPHVSLRGADHYLDLHDDELTVDSVWVVSESVPSGTVVLLEPPLPRDAQVSSDRLEAVYEDGRAVAVVAPGGLREGEHVRLRTTLPHDAALRVEQLPVPSPAGQAIQRVRFARSARFEVGEQTSLDVAAGIQVGRGISSGSRRAVDRALDGPHAHRRMGALYVRTTAGGVYGRLSSGSEQRRGLTLFAAAFFVLAAGSVTALYQRAQRAVQGERVDAYLAGTCAADEARALGVRAQGDEQADRTAG